MGYSGEWVAISGISKEEVLSRLSLRDTGIEEGELIEGVVGAELSNGWYVVIGMEPGLVLENDMEILSAGCRAVCGEVSEGVMISIAREYKDGAKIWEISHDGEEDQYDLYVEGSPPSEFTRIKDSLMQEQDKNGGRKSDIDYIFDVPLEVAETVCGFRHDEIEVLEDGSVLPCMVLEPV